MFRPDRLRPGLIAALLALACQMGFAASVPQPVLTLLAFSPICHSDRSGTAPGQHEKHIPPGAVAPICIALAMPVPPLASTPVLPAPRAVVRPAGLRLPPATAPPALFALAATPRGPPTLA
jgi:hypothetical protein